MYWLGKKAWFLRIKYRRSCNFSLPSVASLSLYKCIYSVYADLFCLYDLHGTLTGMYMNAHTHMYIYIYTGWWFQTFFIFHFIYGMSSFPLTFIFFIGVAQPPTSIYIYIICPWSCFIFVPGSHNFSTPGSGVRELPCLDQGPKSNETCWNTTREVGWKNWKDPSSGNCL